MTAQTIIDLYISFFEKKDHKQIPNAPLIPENDPTTLFTSSGMQPLVPYLLGETHPQGNRLVNVQNAFRAVDIEEVGNNRHTTFFRMLGNWSLGDYFKKEQLPWSFTFLTKELKLDPKRLYVTVFAGNSDIPKDEQSASIWENVFKNAHLDPKERIFYYGVEKNWWSRSGTPDKMPAGEPGGPDSEVFYDFGEELQLHEKSIFKNETCHVNCDCGRFWEIGNSVFMQYQKQTDGSFTSLPKQNVDFGGGLERLIGATENQPDMFMTSLFKPTITVIAKQTQKLYQEHKRSMQIIADHLGGSMFIVASGIKPSNKEQGYILRRLIRRSLDNFSVLGGRDIVPILETIAGQYQPTDPVLEEKFEEIKLTILEEEQTYKNTLHNAKKFISKELIKEGTKMGDELMGYQLISPETAFKSLATYGLGPTQLKNLGYNFDEQALAEKIKEHKEISRKGAEQKFSGGLADTQAQTIMGHTATHLLHQALRDVLGPHVHQTGSNITTERVRFDFNYEQKLTDAQIKQVEDIVNKKIKENLPVHYEMLPLEEAKQIGAIGLFDDKYQDKVKVYFIGTYSKEFCGGPHVDFTQEIKSFKIIKQENIGNKQRRIYAIVGK